MNDDKLKQMFRSLNEPTLPNHVTDRIVFKAVERKERKKFMFNVFLASSPIVVISFLFGLNKNFLQPLLGAFTNLMSKFAFDDKVDSFVQSYSLPVQYLLPMGIALFFIVLSFFDKKAERGYS